MIDSEPTAELEMELHVMQIAVEVLAESNTLADLCKHIVELPQTNFVFSGAHIYFPAGEGFYLDASYGVRPPNNIEQLVKDTALNKESGFLPEEGLVQRAIVSIPFICKNKTGAVAVLVLKSGAQRAYIEKEISSTLSKVAGLYLHAKFGLGY